MSPLRRIYSPPPQRFARFSPLIVGKSSWLVALGTAGVVLAWLVVWRSR